MLRPILIDDMITTGATLVAAADAVRGQGSAHELTAVATHALLVGPAIERLSEIGLRKLVVSDTLPPPRELPFASEVVSVAPLLARALRHVCRS